MEDNPYFSMIRTFRAAGEAQPAAFRLGVVRKASPLTVAVGNNLCDDEIAGAMGGYVPSKGDEVLLACIGGDEEYIILGKVVNT